MPSYADLEKEPWWNAEIVPPNLSVLANKLVTYWGLSPGAIGIKGNNEHLYGYHRSRTWLKSSIYCTNRSYSTNETSGNINGGDSNWLCALDVSLPPELLLPACQRLDAAVRSGRLEKITEWYGNKDGDQRVDGYDNIRNQVATSDSSHLWHLHGSFDRGRANEDHTDVFQILTGTIPIEEFNMAYLALDTQGRAVVITDDWNGWFRPNQATAEATQQMITDRNYWRGKMGLPPEKWLSEDGVNRKKFNFGDDRTNGLFGPDLGKVASGGAPGTGPVDLTDEAVDKVAIAVVDEQAERLQN